VWRVPDDELGVLGDVHGLDVLELGCGAAQWSIALAGLGARPVGLDQSRAQLRHARVRMRAAGTRFPLVCASGEHVPLAASTFDVVFCDHGAMSFCDPACSVAEVARVLRGGGRLAFAHSAPLLYLTYDEKRDRQGRRLRRPYFGIRRFHIGEGTIDFQLPHGEWIRLFRAHGLVVDDLIELRPPKGATTTFADWDYRFARRWPTEQIWKLHKE
jgi:SAM-dependent methyltransferase